MSIIEGRYAHRFTGNALARNQIPFFLSGLGVMNVVKSDLGYAVSGQQESVASPLAPVGGAETQRVLVKRYSFDGTIVWSEEKMLWSAEIAFRGMGAAAHLWSDHSFVISQTATPGHLWIMSSGPIFPKGPPPVIPVEAVSGEARLVEPKAP